MKETSTLSWWMSRTCSMLRITKTISAADKATKSHLARLWMIRDLLRGRLKRSSRGTQGMTRTKGMLRSTTDNSCWIIWRVKGPNRIKTTIQWGISLDQTVRIEVLSNDPITIWANQPPCMTLKTSDKMLREDQRNRLTQRWETSLTPGLVVPHPSITTQWLTTVNKRTRREARTISSRDQPMRSPNTSRHLERWWE